MRTSLFVTLMLLVSCAISVAWAQDSDKLSVAIVMNCQPDLSLSQPDNSHKSGPSGSAVVSCVSDSLGRVFLSSGKYLLIERDKQSLLNDEIRTRVAKGEDPDSVMKDVGSKYRLDYMMYVTAIAMTCQYDPGIIIVQKPTCDGNSNASGSWVRVSTGTTESKPEAAVSLKIRGVEPTAWFDQMSHDLARKLLAKVVPSQGFMVTKILDEKCVLINHGREDGLRETNQLVAREATDAETGLPGKAICYVRVTDRLGDHAAECQVFPIKGGLPAAQIMARLKTLIEAKQCPEVVEQAPQGRGPFDGF